jgi:hypothetical protein
MTTCKAVSSFLDSVSAGKITGTLPAADVATMAQLNLLRSLSNEEFAQLAKEVEGIASTREAIQKDGLELAQRSSEFAQDDRRTHSILFHFEGADRRKAEEDKREADQAALGQADAELQAREKEFADLTAKRAVLDSLVPYAGGYVGLTGLGAMALRDLRMRLYRVGDAEFSAYWAQTQQVDRDLNDIAGQSAAYAAALTSALHSVDRSYLWAIAIGLSKSGGDPNQKVAGFLDAYNAIGSISKNPENRLLSAEILASLGRSVPDSLPTLTQLDKDAHHAGVPKESALGVASILFLGQRHDGTFATANLPPFLSLTRSYESAALLAVVNAPFQELSGQFQAARSKFSSWGYEPSEDIELSSAYLTVSQVPLEGVGTKLAIIARGLSSYLQYPLVAASILASIPVLEANETLGLLEQAYEILGRRTGPLSQAELLCLAVRMIHGIKVATVDELDPTAAAKLSPVSFSYGPRMPFLFVPIIVAHGAYFSTYSGVGGAHPGHIHTTGGFTG